MKLYIKRRQQFMSRLSNNGNYMLITKDKIVFFTWKKDELYKSSFGGQAGAISQTILVDSLMKSTL